MISFLFLSAPFQCFCEKQITFSDEIKHKRPVYDPVRWGRVRALAQLLLALGSTSHAASHSVPQELAQKQHWEKRSQERTRGTRSPTRNPTRKGSVLLTAQGIPVPQTTSGEERGSEADKRKSCLPQQCPLHKVVAQPPCPVASRSPLHLSAPTELIVSFPGQARCSWSCVLPAQLILFLCPPANGILSSGLQHTSLPESQRPSQCTFRSPAIPHTIRTPIPKVTLL